jgi:hypothetical protein
MPISQSGTVESLSDIASLITLASNGRRPNVLFVRDGVPGGEALDRLLQSCARPLHVTALPGEMRLPSTADGTLLLNDVAALTPVQQAALNEWLEAGQSRVQIISIATTPLEVLVRAGEFDEKLFYRLNVVRCGADPASPSENVKELA